MGPDKPKFLTAEVALQLTEADRATLVLLSANKESIKALEEAYPSICQWLQVYYIADEEDYYAAELSKLVNAQFDFGFKPIFMIIQPEAVHNRYHFGNMPAKSENKLKTFALIDYQKSSRVKIVNFVERWLSGKERSIIKTQ